MTDLSPIVQGIILGLILPTHVPIWIPIMGSLFSIIVVKQFSVVWTEFYEPCTTTRAF